MIDLTNPTISVSPSSASIYNDESATFTCTASDANLDCINLYENSLLKNNSCSSTTRTYSYPGSSGSGTVNCTSIDKAGNANSITASITVNTRTTPSSPSGGSPAVNTNTTTPRQEAQKTFGNISAGEEVKFTTPVAVASEGITEISIIPSVNTSNVVLDIKVIAPENITLNASEKVYSYFNITINLNESSIQNATINFDVSQKWINSSNISKENVRLKRYHDNAWTELKTAQLSEDSVKVSYKAESPGFSLFAITAENAVAQQNITSQSTQTQENKGILGKLWLRIVLLIAIISLVVLLYFVFRKNK
jgi:PGF-pre-PGF domain-containing protein